ncbi:MAG TPA: sulfatase [Planctomycetota bacterium]|nr:sulfatase [Planctomycetota bacterium]
MLAACSKTPTGAGDASGLLRLDVVATAPEPRARDVVTVAKLAWPEDPALVAVEGAELLRIPADSANPEPRVRLVADGKAEFRVRLRGRFDPGTFDQLVITASAPHDAYVRAVLRRNGEVILGSLQRARIAPRTADQPSTRAVLDFPFSRRLEPPPDELELVFDNVQSAITLGSLELCSQPIWAFLPAAEDGFAMVDLEGDARLSVGLSTERTLETELLVPQGAILRFSAAIPAALRLVAARPVLRVEIVGERGRPAVQRVPLDTDPTRRASWQSVSLPLESFRGEHVRIVYALEVGEPREAACALTRPRIALPKRTAKTVLLVTSDTHRADAIGALGALGTAASSSVIQTPALDALAARGVLFEDCFSSTNVTIPSHASIMTATSPRDSGVLDNYTRLGARARTLAEAFQDAGFVTFAVVSAPHLSDAGSGLGQGFDRLSAPTESNKRPSAKSIAQLDAWIGEAEGQDLFLWLHLFDAHTPYAPPEEFERLYWPASRDPRDPALPEPVVPDAYRVNLPDGVRDLEWLDARYRGEVSYLDRELGRLFARPRIASGIVAVTADHGESLGEHGIFWEHAGLYPQTIHVPLILAWPSAGAGTRVKQPVFQLDLAQTLLHLAGVADPSVPGRDLLAVRENAPEPRFTISSNAERASVTRDDWHLIFSLRNYLVTDGSKTRTAPKHHVELFDLARDPACLHELAKEELARAKELRRLLCAWLASATPRNWGARANDDPEMAQHLAQLGYTSTAGATTVPAVDPDCACAECAPFRER